MSYANKQGWKITGRSELIGARDATAGVSAEAEYYLGVGKIVRSRLRCGCRPDAIAQAVGLSVVEAIFTLRYAERSPTFILQALVEDWSWETIKHRLRQRRTKGQPAR
ncbi:MAG: hypothetical protein WD894_09280 [Pirellulales bacterium]